MTETLTIQYSGTVTNTHIVTLGRPVAQSALAPSLAFPVGEMLLLQRKPQIYFTPADPDYIFLQALTIDVEQAVPGNVVIAEPVSGIYGTGGTMAEALVDLQSMIIDLYVELTESQSELSQRLRRLLEYLRIFIRPR